MTMQENVMGMQHLGLPCLDMEKSMTWYTEVLGFEKIEEKVMPEDNIHAAFLKKGNLVLEMYHLDEETMKEISARSDGHIDHLALDVKDIQAAFEEMKKTGCTFLDEEIQTLPFFEKGVKFFTVLGPGGEKVEFNQFL